MEVSWQSRKLQELCERQNVAKRKLGTPCAKSLQKKLDAIKEAANLEVLATGKPRALRENLQGHFELNLTRKDRLIFQPDHNPAPKHDSGGIDRTKVTKVKITRIGGHL